MIYYHGNRLFELTIVDDVAVFKIGPGPVTVIKTGLKFSIHFGDPTASDYIWRSMQEHDGRPDL